MSDARDGCRPGDRCTCLTLRRLVAAGFVTGAQPAPKQVMIDLHSYYEHLEACEDPDFGAQNGGSNTAKRYEHSRMLED